MAIGLVSFCLVAMLGLLPVGLTQERKSNEQMRSLQAIGAVAADFQSTTNGVSRSKLYSIKVPAVGEAAESGTLSLDENFGVAGASKYFEVMYKVEPPSTRFSNYRMSIRVARSSMTDVSSKLDTAGVDYVESVIVKPAL